MPTLKKCTLPTHNNLNLSAIFHYPDNPTTSGVIVCHGMLSSKESEKHTRFAEILAQMGHMTLRFDFSGRGESDGNLLDLTFSRQVRECETAIAAMEAKGITRIGLTGSSMGGTVAIITASKAQKKIQGLVTMAAVGRTDLLAQRWIGAGGVIQWKQKGYLDLGTSLRHDPNNKHPTETLPDSYKIGYGLVEDALQIDVPTLGSQINCPWLIIHGEDDEVVPSSEAKTLKTAAPKAVLSIMPEADHVFSDTQHRQQLIGEVTEFMDRALRRDQ